MNNNDDIIAFAYHLGNYECADGFSARARVAREACRDARLSFAQRRFWYGIYAEDSLFAAHGIPMSNACYTESLFLLRRAFLDLSAPCRYR